MDDRKYLEDLVQEALKDPDWELESEKRFFLIGDIGWKLLVL